MEESAAGVEEVGHGQEEAVSPALIAVHPLERSVVVAVGSDLRAFDLQEDKEISLSDNSGGPSHSEDIKAICFGAKGRLFTSAGNDKLVKVWATETWNCMRTVCSEKRVSAVAISHDGLFVTYADKFGVVWILSLDEDGTQVSADKKAVPLLGHYCSIITSLKFSPDGQFIASADRDFKIRITKFPKRPVRGAHEIQSFCLAHTEFVSCLTFTCPPDHSHALLLSGSGDSTVRLWDFISGCLLDTCEVGVKAGLQGPNEGEQSTAVTDLCATPTGSLVVAAIQSVHGVVLLTCNFLARSLSVAKVISIGDHFTPTGLGMGSAAEHLWMVMGASNVPSHGSWPPLACVKVISVLHKVELDEDHHNPTVLEDTEVPGGRKLLEKLQGSLDVAKEEAALAVAAEALKAATRNLLVKRQYSVEQRELRKRIRNDRKLKQQRT